MSAPPKRTRTPSSGVGTPGVRLREGLRGAGKLAQGREARAKGGLGLLPRGRRFGGAEARPLRSIPARAHRPCRRAARAGGGDRVVARGHRHDHTGGRLVFHVFGAVEEFERDLILERTVAGLEAARARGRRGGRKPVMDERKMSLASKLVRDRETPISEVREAVGVSRATLYRYPRPDRSPRRGPS